MTIADFTFHNQANYFYNGNKVIDFVDGGYCPADWDLDEEGPVFDTMLEAVEWFNG